MKSIWRSRRNGAGEGRMKHINRVRYNELKRKGENVVGREEERERRYEGK